MERAVAVSPLLKRLQISSFFRLIALFSSFFLPCSGFQPFCRLLTFRSVDAAIQNVLKMAEWYARAVSFYVRLIDVSDDWRSDNRHFTVHNLMQYTGNFHNRVLYLHCAELLLRATSSNYLHTCFYVYIVT